MHHTDHIIPDQPRPLPEGQLYFVGIGGAGMSAIAQVLAERGRDIRGADPGISPTVKARLEKAGITVYTAHDASQIAGASAVIVSDAIPKANPEVQAAQAADLPIIRRPEALGAIVNAGRGIAISGTHGKTTTTGMVTSILMAAGLDPTVLIGGDLPLIGGNARNGKGEFVVAESCEAYDGFLYLHPEIAVILNIEADHLDYHGDEAHVIASFQRFVSQIKGDGSLIINIDDEKCRDIWFDKKTWGTDNDPMRWGNCYSVQQIPEWFQEEIDPAQREGVSENSLEVIDDGLIHASAISPDATGIAFDVYVRNYVESGKEARVRLRVPGLHNVSNALSAIGVGLELGIPWEHIVAGLESFTGTGRRFERLGEVDEVLIVDDYAHHPTELRATLAAARSAYPDHRLVAVFQPHLPSRTRDQMVEFAEALTAPDVVYLTDIYLAREQPIPGVSSATLAENITALPDAPPVVYVADKRDLPERLAADVRPGDLVITLGAGDIRAAGEGLLRLRSGN